MTAEVPDPVLAELVALRQQVAALSAQLAAVQQAAQRTERQVDQIWRHMP